MRRVPKPAAVSCIGLGLLTLGDVPIAAAADAATQSAPAGELEAAEEASEPERAVAEPTSRVQLGVGTGITLGLGEIWEGRGDVITNAGGPTFLELSLAPSYRVAPDFALGVRVTYGLEPGSRSERSSSGASVSLERDMWQLGLTGRYQSAPARAWYIGTHVGAAAIVDHRGNESVSQWAPHLGAAVGYDLRLAQILSLGLELRAAYAAFGEGSHTAAAGFYDYHVSTWLGGGVVGNLLP